MENHLERNHAESLRISVPLKTALDVARIRKPCRIAEELLFELRDVIRPGTETIEIENFAISYIKKRKAIPALKGYGGFPGAVCISVNNVAAHGIGCGYRLQDGDLVTVDTTIGVDGWYGDAAWTYIAGTADSDGKRLVRAAWKAMLAGIAQAEPGRRLGDIGYAIKRAASGYGCRVMEDLAGHGIGKEIHEEPVVLNFGKPHTGLPVVPGMVFTIEPIVTTGTGKMKIHTDNWSIITGDSFPAAQFEATIAVFSSRTEVLTLEGINLQKYLDFPPMF